MDFLFGAACIVVLELRNFLLTDDVGGLMYTYEDGFGCMVLFLDRKEGTGVGCSGASCSFVGGVADWLKPVSSRTKV